MSLRFVRRTASLPEELRVDAALLSPGRFAGLPPAAAARERLPTPAGDLALGDLFTVAATDGPDDALWLEGDLTRFLRLGAGMRRGSITVRGDVGARAGSGMTGGRLAIDGDAGERAGEGLRGGILLISGAAGDHAGAPLPGRAEGQAGGVLIVRGRAGAGAGFRMRRGLMALGGRRRRRGDDQPGRFFCSRSGSGRRCDDAPRNVVALTRSIRGGLRALGAGRRPGWRLTGTRCGGRSARCSPARGGRSPATAAIAPRGWGA
jgi:hypothetical protein